MSETVDEAIVRHSAEVVRLEQIKERSTAQTLEYLTKILLETLNQVEAIHATVERIQWEVLEQSVKS
jgi:hypothetical protein